MALVGFHHFQLNLLPFSFISLLTLKRPHCQQYVCPSLLQHDRMPCQTCNHLRHILQFLLASWRGVSSEELHRDEHTWLSTFYVQIYAFFLMIKTHYCCKPTNKAWATNVPKWLLFYFVYWLVHWNRWPLYWISIYGSMEYSKNFCAMVVSSALVINALWLVCWRA